MARSTVISTKQKCNWPAKSTTITIKQAKKS